MSFDFVTVCCVSRRLRLRNIHWGMSLPLLVKKSAFRCPACWPWRSPRASSRRSCRQRRQGRQRHGRRWSRCRGRCPWPSPCWPPWRRWRWHPGRSRQRSWQRSDGIVSQAQWMQGGCEEARTEMELVTWPTMPSLGALALGADMLMVWWVGLVGLS